MEAWHMVRIREYYYYEYYRCYYYDYYKYAVLNVNILSEK